MVANNKTKRTKKVGGKVIAAGGFGCVFSPALLCSSGNGTKRNTKSISKLMTKKWALEEFTEINKIKLKLRHIINYNDFFLLRNITICKPAKLTRKDLGGFRKKCSALSNDGITSTNINKHTDKLLALTMPDGGIPVDDYMVKENDLSSMSVVNFKLIELLIKGIIPMNNAHIFHNDIKDSNILVDDKGTQIYTRLIDWGLSCTYVPNKNKALPPSWRSRPFQYNNPYSIILFSQRFADKYQEFINNVNGDITSRALSSFVDDFIGTKYTKGHYKLMTQIIKMITTEEPRKYIIKYIVEILLTFKGDLRSYLDNIFIQNVDKWGLVTCYYPMLHFYHIQRTLNATDRKTHTILKELFNYTYQSGSVKLDVGIITDYLRALDSTIKINDDLSTPTRFTSTSTCTTIPLDRM